MRLWISIFSNKGGFMTRLTPKEIGYLIRKAFHDNKLKTMQTEINRTKQEEEDALADLEDLKEAEEEEGL